MSADKFISTPPPLGACFCGHCRAATAESGASGRAVWPQSSKYLVCGPMLKGWRTPDLRHRLGGSLGGWRDPHAGRETGLRAWAPPRPLRHVDLQESLGTRPSSVRRHPSARPFFVSPAAQAGAPPLFWGASGRTCPCAQPLGHPPNPQPLLCLHSEAPRGPGRGPSGEQRRGRRVPVGSGRRRAENPLPSKPPSQPCCTGPLPQGPQGTGCPTGPTSP